MLNCDLNPVISFIVVVSIVRIEMISVLLLIINHLKSVRLLSINRSITEHYKIDCQKRKKYAEKRHRERGHVFTGQIDITIRFRALLRNNKERKKDRRPQLKNYLANSYVHMQDAAGRAKIERFRKMVRTCIFWFCLMRAHIQWHTKHLMNNLYLNKL